MGQWGRKENQMTLACGPNLNLLLFWFVLQSEQRFNGTLGVEWGNNVCMS